MLLCGGLGISEPRIVAVGGNFQGLRGGFRERQPSTPFQIGGALLKAPAPRRSSVPGRRSGCPSFRRVRGVTDGGRVIGLITLSGVTRFIQLKIELEEEEHLGAPCLRREMGPQWD